MKKVINLEAWSVRVRPVVLVIGSLHISARAEICSYARKHFRSPKIVEFGTHVDLIACTPPDINKPGDILRNPSGALEG